MVEAILRDWQCRKKRHSTGRSMRSGEDVDHVRQAFIRGLKKSISKASAESKMRQITFHRILQKNQHLKPYKLKVVQKLTACDKQLRSQFAAHIFQNMIILSHIVLMQYFTSLDVLVGITVSFG
jgi:hypothetical protein